MRVNVLQNEQLKMKKIILKETGVDFEKLGETAEWKGRHETLEYYKMLAVKREDRIKELTEQLQVSQVVEGFDMQKFCLQKEKDIKEKYIDQLNSFQQIIDEKTGMNATLAEKINL